MCSKAIHPSCDTSMSYMEAPLYIRCDVDRDEGLQVTLADGSTASKGRAGLWHCSQL